MMVKVIYNDKLVYKEVIWVFFGISLWKEKEALNSPMWGKYGNTSQLIEHTARQSLTVFCSRFSSEISFNTYLHTIYIKFI